MGNVQTPGGSVTGGPVSARSMIDHANHADHAESVTVTINDAGHSGAASTAIDERAEVESGLVRDTPRNWSGELTLFHLWRRHTLKELSEDCISHWTERNEAEFRDDLYHSGFRWRVLMMSSLAFAICMMVLVDPCLTMLGVLTCPFQIMLIVTQMIAKRMTDQRRARHVGQWSLIAICVGFGLATVPMGLFASSGAAPTWRNGEACGRDLMETNHPIRVLNIMVGPATTFIGVMVTFMTISTRGFVVIVTCCIVPACTACEWPPIEPSCTSPICTFDSAHSVSVFALSDFLVNLIATESPAVSPLPSAAMGVAYMLGCFGGGATIGCMYVVMKRRAAIKLAHEQYLAHRKTVMSTERVEEVEKARGFDRELMMAMTFHEVRNPLNGTVGHLRLAKQIVAGMRRGDVIGGNGVRDAIGGQSTGRHDAGSEGSGSALGALEEEVDQSIIATEIAVQYLGTLATLHGALTGSRKLALEPTELTKLIRSAAAVVRPQMQPGVELRVEVPEAEMHVMMDGLMLMQVRNE